MRLSVVICTWNRCELLRQTLERMIGLRVPPDADWEVLVVDNHSTDETKAAAESFAGRLPLRYLFEGRKGKSNALNLAMREATGEYLLFTDDDVLVEPDWMEAYAAAFRAHPETAVFGGAIEPWFEGEPPAWLPAVLGEIESAWALRRIPAGRAPFPIEKDYLPFGANLAVRKAEQLRFPYDPALGPSEDTQMRGEETEMLARMLEAGVRALWIPQARVRHYLPAYRQTPRFLRQVWHGLGVLSGRRMAARGENGSGARLGLRIAWLLGQSRFLLGRTLGAPSLWVHGLRKAAMAGGRLEGLRG